MSAPRIQKNWVSNWVVYYSWRSIIIDIKNVTYWAQNYYLQKVTSNTRACPGRKVLATSETNFRLSGQSCLKLYLCIWLLLLSIYIRGHSQMTSGKRGREGLAKFWRKEGRLRGFGTDKGGGVQNPENLVDVICEWPLRLTKKQK